MYRLDQISRNIVDFMTITEKLQSSGIGFISINERFDTTTPMGRAMMADRRRICPAGTGNDCGTRTG